MIGWEKVCMGRAASTSLIGLGRTILGRWSKGRQFSEEIIFHGPLMNERVWPGAAIQVIFHYTKVYLEAFFSPCLPPSNAHPGILRFTSINFFRSPPPPPTPADSNAIMRLISDLLIKFASPSFSPGAFSGSIDHQVETLKKPPPPPSAATCFHQQFVSWFVNVDCCSISGNFLHCRLNYWLSDF